MSSSNKKSKIVSYFKKFLLLLIIGIFSLPLLYLTFVYYDARLSKAGRSSYKFNKKIEQFLKENRESFKLEDLVEFEWDRVCVIQEENNINLKDKELIRLIGFKPKFLFRSNYYVYDNYLGFLFINSMKQSVYILHQIYDSYDVNGSRYLLLPNQSGCLNRKGKQVFQLSIKKEINNTNKIFYKINLSITQKLTNQ